MRASTHFLGLKWQMTSAKPGLCEEPVNVKGAMLRLKGYCCANVSNAKAYSEVCRPDRRAAAAL